ncbi:MAG: hypothetical protein RBT74_12490 [Tenuifilaceae bacterium]|jgi:hypothetical protein|nr:hypothetical protein [Tenuifilaceae bacterium]
MKTANVTTKNNANVAQTGQVKSSPNRIAAPVPEATRQFIISTTGSEVIEPIPNSRFCNTIVDFVKAGGSSQSFSNNRSGGGGTISVILPHWVSIDATDKNLLQSFVGQKLYEGFRTIYLGFMQASFRAQHMIVEQKRKEFCERNNLSIAGKKLFYRLPSEGNKPKQWILDFCCIYHINSEEKVIKMLENIWHRSTEKKELYNLPHDASLEKN